MGLFKNESDGITGLYCELEKEQKRQQFFEIEGGGVIRLSAIDFLNPYVGTVILRSGETLYFDQEDGNRLKQALLGEAEQ